MKRILLLACVLFSLQVVAQKKTKADPATQQVNANKEAALAALNNAYEADKKTALQIWEYAEVGLSLIHI
jgi:aminobenzoyl-glutamate utilization protein B